MSNKRMLIDEMLWNSVHVVKCPTVIAHTVRVILCIKQVSVMDTIKLRFHSYLNYITRTRLYN